MERILVDPEAIRETVRLIEEYLFKGGHGFDEQKLATAREQLTQFAGA